jgi:DNA-binding response OmpR family regulator
MTPPNATTTRVLIVEDEPALLDIYATKLRMNGYQVITAKDGIEGIEAAIHEDPHLILLDVLIPFKDGFEVLKDLKSHPKTKDVPVIILSNLGQEYEVKRGLALGAESFLTKANLTPARVVEEVKRVLETKKVKGGA